MTLDKMIHFIAQGAINVDTGLTTIEKGSNVHKAMHRFCEAWHNGEIGVIPDLKVDRSKFVTSVRILDPDSRLTVEIEIRKLESGGLIGFDGSFLEQLGPDENPYHPYVRDAIVVVPDNEVKEESEEEKEKFEKVSTKITAMMEVCHELMAWWEGFDDTDIENNEIAKALEPTVAKAQGAFTKLE